MSVKTNLDNWREEWKAVEKEDGLFIEEVENNAGFATPDDLDKIVVPFISHHVAQEKAPAPHRQFVIVEWKDSFGVGSSWCELADLHKPIAHIIKSAGWLVKESDDAIILVANYAEANKNLGANEQVCGDITIPRACIVSMVCLDDKKKEGA